MNPFKHIVRRFFEKNAPGITPDDAARLNQTRYNAIYALDPDVLVRHLTAFNQGDIAGLERILDEFEMREDKMKIGAFKMAAAVASKPWEVRIRKGEEDNPRARLHQETLTKFWNRIETTDAFCRNRKGGIRTLVKQMMQAQSRVYSVHDICWHVEGDGSLKATFTHVPAWCFENRSGRLRYIAHDGQWEGDPMRDGEWLVTVGEGVGVTATILAMAKRLSWNDWLLFSERCGMPVVMGNTSAVRGTDSWDAMARAIRSIAPKTGILADAGTTLNAVSMGGNGQTTYKDLIDVVDRSISALYRGGDLATVSQGGDSVGSNAQDGESELMDADGCAMISETLRDQVERFVVRFTCGDFEPLAEIVINPPAETEDVDREIKIDTHLAGLGVKLSKRDALVRYGRAEAADDDDALEPPLNAPQTGFQGGFNAFANEAAGKTPFKTHNAPFKNVPRNPDLQGDADGADASRAVLAAFAKDTSKAADAVKALLADPTPEKARALLADLPNLIPEDPALEAVIAEAMAKEFRTASEDETPGLANEQPRGKTTQGTNSGSFAPEKGESKKAREKREKAERQTKHMEQGSMNMPDVLAGKDVRNFMPGFRNAKVHYDHIAFYQGDADSGYIHIRDHEPDMITKLENHQPMLEGNKIPETIAKGTWYDDGLGIRCVFNDQLVILGRDGDGYRILSAYISAEKAKRTRSDTRFVRLMNEKEDAL